MMYLISSKGNLKKILVFKTDTTYNGLILTQRRNFENISFIHKLVTGNINFPTLLTKLYFAFPSRII